MGPVVTLERNAEHVAEGQAAVIYDQRKPRLQALLGSYLAEVQAVEDAVWDLYLGTMLSDAAGDALDKLGALVTQPRENRTDDVYRAWIRARVAVLRSSGKPEQLLRIARMVLPAAVSVALREEYPAALRMVIGGAIDDALGAALTALLKKAKADGVRLLVAYETSVTPFRYAPSGSAELGSPSGYGAGDYATVS